MAMIRQTAWLVQYTEFGEATEEFVCIVAYDKLEYSLGDLEVELHVRFGEAAHLVLLEGERAVVKLTRQGLPVAWCTV